MASISSSLFIMTILSLALLLNVSAALGGRKGGGVVVGGWERIKNPKDPSVVEIGKFAVTEHNKKTKENLTFKGVISGETQVVSGTNYKVIIAVGTGRAAAKYEAIVWEKPWEHFRQLTSFKKV